MAKIDIFRDKEYEGFDWLNKAVEPFVYAVNDIASTLPERIEIGFDEMLSLVTQHYSMSFEIHDILRMLIPTQESLTDCADLYKLEIPNNLTVDFENKTMSDKIVLYKVKPQYDDADIVHRMTEISAATLRMLNSEKSNIGRMNEIMDLLPCDDERASRSIRRKRNAIMISFRKILSEDKWKIRNYDLAIKCAQWMRGYIENGNLADLSNFSKLKCMTHKGAPIYSMEETK